MNVQRGKNKNGTILHILLFDLWTSSDFFHMAAEYLRIWICHNLFNLWLMGGYLVCFHFLNMASNESKNILSHILFHLPVFISIINISGNGLEIMHTSVIINCIRLTFQNCYYAQINNLSKHIWEYPFPNILASTRCYQYFKTLLIWLKMIRNFFMLHWFLVCIFIVYLWFFFCELSYLYSLQFYISLSFH